jgi:hypothetical protein
MYGFFFFPPRERERKRAHPKKSTHSAKLNLYEQEKKKISKIYEIMYQAQKKSFKEEQDVFYCSRILIF